MIVWSDGATAWEALTLLTEEGIVVVGVYGLVLLPSVVEGGEMEVVVGLGNGFP